MLLLIRSINGIKEAPQIWFMLLSAFLATLGYYPLDVDPCVFRHPADDYRLIVLHVDDMKLVFESREVLDRFKAALAEEYKTQPIADLGPIKECIGIEYTKIPDGFELRVTKYLDKIAKKFNLEGCNGRLVPISAQEWKNAETGDHALLEGDDLNEYFAMVGCIQYPVSALIRDDVAVSAHKLGSVRARANTAHFDIAKGVLRYLVGSADRAVVLRRGDPDDMTLVWYSDADHAADRKTCHSVTGGCGFVGGCPLTHVCQSQKSVQISSTGSETVAMSVNAREIIYHVRLLEEFGFPQNGPIDMFIDNQASKALSENLISLTSLSKHLAVRDRFIREAVRNKITALKWIAGCNNIADFFTKILVSDRFRSLAAIVSGMVSRPAL